MFWTFFLWHQAYVPNTKWKKLLIDWNEYQEKTTSIGFQFSSPELVGKTVLHVFLIMLDYIKGALRNKQLITSNAENLKFSWLISCIITMQRFPLKPFRFTADIYIEPNHLICIANQMTGFYME